MRVLSLSLDNLILEPQSQVASRIVEYGNMVEKYIVLVPDVEKKEQDLSDKVKVFGSGGVNKISQLIKTCKIARELFKQYKFDVITVQDQYYLALLGFRLSRKFKVGLELQIHGLEKFTGIRKMIARFVIPRADSIRVVSARLKKRLVEELGVAADKIMVIPIYSHISHNTYHITHDRDKFVFLTVGRLVEIKNISLQIEAFKKLLEKYKNIELQIVGGGPCEEKLRKEAAGIEQIKFIAWQDNLEDFYKNADAYLLTSNYEGWGLVIIEAASYGLPIIMTDVGCAGEVIKNNESGLVIPVGNKEKLEEAMELLIFDNNLRNKIIKGAQAAISKLPSKEETLKLYLENWEKASCITYNISK